MSFKGKFLKLLNNLHLAYPDEQININEDDTGKNRLIWKTKNNGKLIMDFIEPNINYMYSDGTICKIQTLHTEEEVEIIFLKYLT